MAALSSIRTDQAHLFRVLVRGAGSQVSMTTVRSHSQDHMCSVTSE